MAICSHNLEPYLLLLLPIQLALIKPVSVPVVHPLTLVTTCLLLLPITFLSLVDYVSVHPRCDFLSTCMLYVVSFPDPQYGMENEAMIDKEYVLYNCRLNLWETFSTNTFSNVLQ